MFRLPFAAGRVFSISMLDTLLYQVGSRPNPNTLTRKHQLRVHFPDSRVGPESVTAAISILVQKCPLVLTEITPSPSCRSIKTRFCDSSVFCEGLHDSDCKAVAGAGHHSRVRIPLRCEFWKIITQSRTTVALCINSSLISDEGNRGGPLDWHLWETVPETLLIQC